MQILSASGAPAAVGPYSHAVRANGLLFCSGQVALDPEKGVLVGEDVATQTHQVFANIRAVLGEAGLTLSDVAKTTVYLQTMDDFGTMNGIYAEHFGDHKPARSTVAVAGLPVGALVEIEVLAVLKEG
ncbi:RidA family protein [Rubricoccus marinus]|uniref:Reactive intermediate/imine deaminase n=1 Tax=Rubricoccus marinus TaxID=716817 RepID=A0A259U265_9BACT|nr:RidA family protein [Rubricoccus marinus]OZC04125.1 hypothetical protein BSZ36_14725 [Rubricoccus marinus]